ncbi:ankyrin [Cryphonectria parasitica EP155]|uniref:Ankyrin n=1 Tax=Cryphonectria parasitica (strain ATCC 38755 / EP155) TaxID=660469 RepID=A0A9P4XZ90_CRYP1|nr:ankyrin [Cryphonectria parasitica EP155]KAF3764064.1 ankyrin [Cryphonectria parasitica EP155]
MAHLGLDDLVETLKEENDDEEDYLWGLIKAARQGHLSTVQMLKPGKGFSVHDPTLERLVAAALSSGNAEVVQEIMELMPRGTPSPGPTPSWRSKSLLKACWLGNEELVGILLNLGADLHATMKPKEHFPGSLGIFELVVQKKATSVIKWLLLSGLSTARDVDIMSNPDTPPAMAIAAVKGNIRALKVLLECRDDINESQGRGTTTNAFYEAARIGRPDIVRLLLQSADEQEPRKVDVHFLTSEHMLWIAKTLIELDVEGDGRGLGGLTPLLYSAYWGTPAIAKMLEDDGANLTVSDPGERMWTLLHAEYDQPKVVRILLDAGVDPTVRHEANTTPLSMAAETGQVECLRMMLSSSRKQEESRSAVVGALWASV